MANYTDDKSKAQFLDGTSGDDTFIIDGVASEYEYYKTPDPRGGSMMVVWRKDGRGQADVLNNIENIQFTDKMVTPEVTDNGTVYTTTNTSDNTSNRSSDTSTDDTPTHDPDLDEYIYDDANVSEYIDGAGGDDSFVINDDSSKYGWNPTEDGLGVVVWCPSTGCFDVLYNVEEIIFNDQTILVSDIMNMPDTGDSDNGSDGGADDVPGHDLDLDEYIYDEYDISEEINGYGGHDSFVVQASSSLYGWGSTEDGQGIVIWNNENGCFDILHNVEEVIFDDITLSAAAMMNGSDNGGSDGGSDDNTGGSAADEYIIDDAWSSEVIDGGAGEDTFVIDGWSDYYMWDFTDDGQGIVIWNENSNTYDTLYNVEEIWFNDMSVWVSDLIGGGSDDGGSNGGSDDNTGGSPADEYIIDDASKSEVIDGGAGEDTFVIDGWSDYYMWDFTDDGQGIVIWNENTNTYDTLYNVEEIWFNDMSVWVSDLIGGGSDDGGSNGGSDDNAGGSPADEYIIDDAWSSEVIDGGAGDDTFVINGWSDDFMWDWTDDGSGIMIWNLDTDKTDTLYNIEEISFNDTDVWVSDLNGGSNTNSQTNNNSTNNNSQTNNSNNSNNNSSNTAADEFIIDDASQSEVIDGGAGIDTFVIDGNSANFMYDTNDSGTGILIYNEITDTTDELLNIEEIEFNDVSVLVEDLI